MHRTALGAVLALICLPLALHADFMFWLDAPKGRSNPHDPKNPLFAAWPTASLPPAATATPVDTPTVSPTRSPTPPPSPVFSATASPTRSASPTETALPPTSTISPTHSASPTISATPSQSPAWTATCTRSFSATPAATGTFTVSPTPSRTPTTGPTPCYISGPVVSEKAWYDDTASPKRCFPSPCGGPAGTWDTATNYDDTVAPLTGTYHLVFDFTLSGWWSDRMHMFTNWDPGKAINMANYDTLEFWVRKGPASVAPMTAMLISLHDGSNGTPNLPFSGTYAPNPINDTWTKVTIPLCKFDFSGAVNEASIQGVRIMSNAPSSGFQQLFVDDGYFRKY